MTIKRVKVTTSKDRNFEYTPIIADSVTNEIVWQGRPVATKAEALRIAENKLNRWELVQMG